MNLLSRYRNRLIGNKMVMVVLVICTVLISGCRAKTPAKYGREYNDERKKRLLPIIPEGWHWFWRLNTWAPSQDIVQTAPHYASKYITYDEQGLHAENDKYYSGKTYPEPDPDYPKGTMRRERLDISYDYDAHREGRYPWTFSIDSGKRSEPPGTLEEAEAILKSWGVERLNYPGLRGQTY